MTKQPRHQQTKTSQLGLERLENRYLLTGVVGDGNFENGLGNFYALGGSFQPTSFSQSGSGAALITGRSQDWHGIGRNLDGLLAEDGDYKVSLWVRVANTSAPQTIYMGIKQTDLRGTNFETLRQTTVSNNGWVRLEGGFRLETVGALSALELYVGGPAPGVNFYVDNVCIESYDWQTDVNQRIDQIRKRDVSVQVVDQVGNPVPNVNIDVNQVASSFGWGTAVDEDIVTNPTYRSLVLDQFNQATIENDSQWRRTEEFQDIEEYGLLDSMVQILDDGGLDIRGHSVYYGDADSRPTWTDGLNNNDLFNEMIQRNSSIVNRYEGIFDSWDVNNETIKDDGGYFRDRFGDWIQSWMFTETKTNDPNVRLATNEFGVIAGGEAIDRYRSYLDRIIAAGAPVENIGIQGHFSTTASSWDIQKGVEQFTDYGLPISITELDYLDAGPNRRAENLDLILRTLYSIPQVSDVTLWGFWAGNHWLGQNASLWNNNFAPNEAGIAYQNLRSEFTTTIDASTGNDNRLDFRGFHGDYEIVARIPGTNEFVTQTVSITNNPGQQQVQIQLPITVQSDNRTIQINAAGTSNNEQMQLLVDGSVVQTFNNVGGNANAAQYQTYSYTHSNDLTPERIRIAFTNDAGGRDLRVDSIRIGSTTYQTESPSVLSTGTWSGNSCSPGIFNPNG